MGRYLGRSITKLRCSAQSLSEETSSYLAGRGYSLSLKTVFQYIMSELEITNQGLVRGHRIPNFSLPSHDGKSLLLYEFASGQPLLIGGCSTKWGKEACRQFALAIHSTASSHNAQSVVLLSEENAIEPQLSANSATAVDTEGTIRRRIFGLSIDGDESVVHVTDPNLRILNGATVESKALAAATFAKGLSVLLNEAELELKEEAEHSPSVAPVLIVPRVLPPDLCQDLVNSFDSWEPYVSPMPQGDGSELAVDTTSKARSDVWIADKKLEQVVGRIISDRVMPELFKAFSYRANRFERLKMVCYSASDKGHFQTHRDNTTPKTAHRRFALTINLNADDYEGGALEFPEYGPQAVYNVPTGAAIVFSCSHAHRVQPVTQGKRYAFVSFIFSVDT